MLFLRVFGEILKISETIEQEDFFKEEMIINFSLQDINFEIKTIDIMGHIIQEWFGEFLKKKRINFSSPQNTQEYPDYILDDNQYLEVKAYDAQKNAAFDLANFKSYIESLLIHPKRLDSYYITFNYKLGSNGRYLLNDYRISKIWQMTGISAHGRTKDLITCQQKQGTVYNLRPYGSFFSKPENTFGNCNFFLKKISDTIDSFSSQLISQESVFEDGQDWLNKLKQKYLDVTGNVIN